MRQARPGLPVALDSTWKNSPHSSLVSVTAAVDDVDDASDVVLLAALVLLAELVVELPMVLAAELAPVLALESVLSRGSVDEAEDEAEDDEVVVELVENVEAPSSRSAGLMRTPGAPRRVSWPSMSASIRGTMVSSSSMAVARPKRKPTWLSCTLDASKPLAVRASVTSLIVTSPAAPGK